MMKMERNIIHNVDCLQGMKSLKNNSIDMIFSDLPYGITQNSWDHKIPLTDYILIEGKMYTESEFYLWCYKNKIDFAISKKEFQRKKQTGLMSQFNRIIKENGCIALWAQGKFASELIESNKKYYRYQWIIEKTKGTGHLNSHNMPMKCHEAILIFYKKLPVYNPQKTTGHSPVHTYTKHTHDGTNYGKVKIGVTGGGATERFPRDVLKQKWDTQKLSLHPNQKPLEICEYIIKTYTNARDIVLDASTGSGTIPLAARNTDRDFIGYEKDREIYNICMNRLC